MSSSWNPADLALVAVAILFLGLLTWLVAPVLSPFVAAGAVLYLLWPLREAPVPRRLIGLTILLFALWFLYAVSGLLAPFIVALLIAYICNPAVSALERRRVPRWVSSLGVVLVLIGAVAAMLIFVIPPAVRQFDSMISGLGGLARDFSDFLQSGVIFDSLERLGIVVDRAALADQISPRVEGVLSALLGGVLDVVTGFSALVLHIINIIIIPFLVFYLLLDYHRLGGKLLGFVPGGQRARVEYRLAWIDRLLGRYLRGAILVALIQGTLSTVVLWFIGVRYPLVLGIMTALLNFIPYVGLLTTMVVASIVALLSGDPVLARVAGVVILYLSQKLLEATVLGPGIIGAQVGLHPVLLILCLLIFGYFLGFIGLLIAVPVTALLVAAMDERRTAAEVPPAPAET
jgi:predicted PurR-regulated permease PerM